MFESTKQKLRNFVFAKKGIVVDESANMGDIIAIVIGIVVIGVAGAIGIFIMDKIVTVTGTPSNSALANSSTSLLNTIDTGFSFIVILLIAVVGAIAIGTISGLMRAPNQNM